MEGLLLQEPIASREVGGPMVAEGLSSAQPEATSGEMLKKQLRWYDPFAMIFAAGVAVFITLGFTMAELGTWGAMLVAGIVAVIALFQNVLWAEMAAMFPNKVGGITLFANEAWKRRFQPIGALSTFGYWCGWSLVLGVFGIGLGSLVQAQWFPTVTWGWGTPWGVKLGLPQVIAVGAVLLAWIMNIIGIRIAAWVSWALAAAFGVVVAIFLFAPFIGGLWHASNISWHISSTWHGPTGIQSVLVWLYVVGWSVYPSEMPATFAPEYRDTVKDTRRGLAACGIAYLLLWVILPMTTAGAVGDKFIAQNPASFGVAAFNKIMGGGAGVAVAIMCAAIFVTMIAGSADASRALYGMALDRMTLKQLAHLNRRGMPSRALTVERGGQQPDHPLRRQPLVGAARRQPRLLHRHHRGAGRLHLPPQGPGGETTRNPAAEGMDGGGRRPERGECTLPVRRGNQPGADRVRQPAHHAHRRRYSRDFVGALLVPPSRSGQKDWGHQDRRTRQCDRHRHQPPPGCQPREREEQGSGYCHSTVQCRARNPRPCSRLIGSSPAQRPKERITACRREKFRCSPVVLRSGGGSSR